jgi:hypothetical protein
VTRPHDCINYVDLRYAGADDYEGHMECAICRVEYSADELSRMHETQQRIYDGIEAASSSLILPREAA